MPLLSDCGFLSIIEAYDKVMAERGFRMREDLMMSIATLCILPRCSAAMQMLCSDVRKTSNIANVRISPEAKTLKEGFRTMIGSEKV